MYIEKREININGSITDVAWLPSGNFAYINWNNELVIKSAQGVEQIRTRVGLNNTRRMSVSSNGNILVSGFEGVLQFGDNNIQNPIKIIPPPEGWIIDYAINVSRNQSDVFLTLERRKSNLTYRLCMYNMDERKPNGEVSCKIFSLQMTQDNVHINPTVNDMLYDGKGNILINELNDFPNQGIYLFSLDGVYRRKLLPIEYPYSIALDLGLINGTKILYVGQKCGRVTKYVYKY